MTDDHQPFPTFDLYVPDPLLPPAWLFDIDGTLALKGDRHPFDWDNVGRDTLNEAVAVVLNALSSSFRIILVSGRDEVCRQETLNWLTRHDIRFDELLMRPSGDYRKDAIVKYELFGDLIAPRYRIQGVLDDRDQVVSMWREIGLPCFQVAPGDF